MGKPPKFKRVAMPSDANNEVKLEVLSKNLRRNFLLFSEFRDFVESSNLKDFNLRWLISISDSYFRNGTDIQRALAGNISTFATMFVRFADTIFSGNDIKLPDNHNIMYDGMTSINLTYCDTMQNWFMYQDRLQRIDPFLYRLWREIKGRFQQQSPMLREIAAKHKRGIFNPPPYWEWKYENQHYEDEPLLSK